MAVLRRVGPGSAGASGCAARAPQRLSNRHMAPGGGRTAAHPWVRAHTHTRTHACAKDVQNWRGRNHVSHRGSAYPTRTRDWGVIRPNKRPQAARGLSATRAPFSLAAPLLMLARHCVNWGLPGPDLRAPRRPQPQGGTWSAGGGEAGPGHVAPRSRLLASALAGPGPRLPSPASVFFLSEEEELGGFLLGRSVCRKTSPFAPPP